MKSRVAKLLEEIDSQRCQVVEYSDEIMIIIRGLFLSTLIKIIQRTLNMVETMFAKTNLWVNSKMSKSSRGAISGTKNAVLL